MGDETADFASPSLLVCRNEEVARTPADMTPELAVTLAGYSAKWAQVLALHTNGTVAGAIVDTNSDGRWLCMETYWLSDPQQDWQPGLSIGAGTFGSATRQSRTPMATTTLASR